MSSHGGAVPVKRIQQHRQYALLIICVRSRQGNVIIGLALVGKKTFLNRPEPLADKRTLRIGGGPVRLPANFQLAGYMPLLSGHPAMTSPGLPLPGLFPDCIYRAGCQWSSEYFYHYCAHDLKSIHSVLTPKEWHLQPDIT